MQLSGHPATTRTRKVVDQITNFESNSHNREWGASLSQSIGKRSHQEKSESFGGNLKELRINNYLPSEMSNSQLTKNSKSDIDWKSLSRAQSLSGVKEFQGKFDRGEGILLTYWQKNTYSMR